ncbi:MAG: M48 family metallopeptidase [Marinilabiliaceae bacterium]|nr:M48 family metallopeptidase [Marinilabiliaceae bacterium]
MEQILFYLIIAFVVFEYVMEQWLDRLNRRAWSHEVPEPLRDVYDADKFENHKQYRRVNFSFSQMSEAMGFVATLLVLGSGALAMVDGWAASITVHPVGRGLLFFGIIGVAASLFNLPFSWYHTFVIEQRFGFNTTTRRTFVTDLLKGVLLSLLIGAPLMGGVMYLFQWLGEMFWVYAWLLISGFSVFMSMFYTSWILPIFNNQKPLDNGSLRDSIETFSLRSGFRLDNIYVMDGSKRSTKGNAFFSGLGSRKRIVLYDTLINDLTEPEIVAVLAHEVGHYKLRHTLWGMLMGIAQTGVLLFLFSLFVTTPELTKALGGEGVQFHIGLVAFGLLFSPISLVIGLMTNGLSRRNEYAADRFAANHADGQALVSALKKLSANSLGNPTPHPAYVWFHYSHPPLLQRIKALMS